MPRADRSITILTGMIIAALYVILLVGFTQESYMRRDAASRLNGAGGWTAVHDAAKRVCRIERPVCAELTDAAEGGAASPRSTPFGRVVSEPLTR